MNASTQETGVAQNSPTRTDTYYRDHWLVVEPERLDAYETMFQWRDGMEPLLVPAELAAGQVVVDYGCGPGHLAAELARRVGAGGRVVAVDINDEFLARTRARAEQEGLSGRVSAERLADGRIPLEEASADRVVCKNVLEYVDDPAATIREFHRVLRPGGLAHVIDSDWAALIVEPLGHERIAALLDAARPAFRTPQIGRRLYGIFRETGFSEVRVQVLANADLRGFTRPILQNLTSYARASGSADESELANLLADADRALEEQRWLALLPQFLVTGQR